jgi:tryptophanyl-tRNA synthetase
MHNIDFVVRTEKELISRLTKLEREEIVVTFGVRPSGELHIGHLATLVEALSTIKTVCNKLNLPVKCYVKIVDLDSLDDFNYCYAPILYWGRVFKYVEPSLSFYVERIKEVFNILSETFDLKINVFLESEIYKMSNFKQILFSWIKNEKVGTFPDKIQVYGICAECKHFSALFYREEEFLFKCLNEKCNKNSLSEEVFNIDNQEICFNLIDRPMIKDEFWNTGVHIIGGDHLRRRPGNSRMDILANRSIKFFGKIPLHYSTGKIILGNDNEKMSKSRRNVVSAKKFIDKNHDWHIKILSVQDEFKV